MSDSEGDVVMEEEESFAISSEEEDFDMEESSDEEEPTPVPKKVAVGKKAGTKSSAAKSASVLTQANTNVPKEAEAAPAAVAAATGKAKKKTVEQTYQKKSQREHILIRPDTYVGSVEPDQRRMFVLIDDQIVEREITFTPALYKIFDEIIVNAADNKQRDPNMDRLEVTIDAESNTISVKNNGKGVPVVKHKDHDCYVPELIFGHLLTGSNFDDKEKKTTGGRNGYGAKLANVFSTSFTVECVDTENGYFYKQTFSDNMENKTKPTVKTLTAAQKKKGDYVKITFSPDLNRFNMNILDEDTVALLSKRAYDIAGTMSNSKGKRLGVWLNGKKLDVKDFATYLKKFSGINQPLAIEKIERWEVAVSWSDDQTMKHVSFVNAISTSKGGQHVNYILDQVASHLQKHLKSKNKSGTEIKPALIKNHCAIYVNALVDNPAFDSQTKDFLTTKAKDFGSECKLSDKFLKKLNKGDLVDAILSFAAFKDKQALNRKGGKKKTKLTGIAKLDDANNAGGAKSLDCTLIITEGDSAKSLAVSGLSVVGRDIYGVFPLRGKPLNVRDATKPQVMKNEEIKNLVDIMGLKYEKKYDCDADMKTLRYGHLMIMADQDTDGSHIKGLVINFLHHFWPKLLDRPGFLVQFITPIVKVSKGKKMQTFFNLPEYNSWLESTGNNGKGWTIKYYKGLGTSTSAEAKEYFSNLETHEIGFAPLEDDKIGEDDNVEEEDENNDLAKALPDSVKSGSDLIDMVFKKTRVEDRKHWLNNMDQDCFLDYSEVADEGVMYSDFINKEYILFSRYDNIRSIPHMIDGFKPSQRKVLFGCIKRKLKGEVKVAQLTGYIAEHSAYHHGETSLQGAIIGMAQNFVGSNNINLLTPAGQFGTRRMGGKDAASARYIFTKLEPITRLIFHEHDDALLNFQMEEGQSIEPDFYMPVIPMVLVNGAEGIGTGWSSLVPNYDVRDIIRNLQARLDGGTFEPMVPFYYGFTGDVVAEQGKSAFTANGKIERINETTLRITELPIRKWTADYKVYLEKLLTGDGKDKESEIKDFKENHTDTTVDFTVIADKSKIDEFEKEKGGLLGKFKLGGTLNTSNMTLFDDSGKIAKFQDPRNILGVFYELRLNYYNKRKTHLVGKLKIEQKKLSNKARFVQEVCEGTLVVSNRKRKEILAELQEKEYDTFLPNKNEAKSNDDDSDDEDEEMGDKSDSELAKGYEYLLGMKIWSLTFEKAEQLRMELADKTKELADLEATSPSQIWSNDLNAISEELDARDEAFAEAQKDELQAQKKSKKRQAKVQKKKPAAKGRKKKKDEWDSDEESEEEDEVMVLSDDEVMERKPAAKKKPTKKVPLKKAAQPKKKVQSPSSPSNESQGSLAGRLASKMNISPAGKAAAPKKRPPPSPALASPPPKPAAAKKAAGKKMTEDSEDELSFTNSSGEEDEVLPTRGRSGRARKPTTYAIDSSDSEDEL